MGSMGNTILSGITNSLPVIWAVREQRGQFWIYTIYDTLSLGAESDEKEGLQCFLVCHLSRQTYFLLEQCSCSWVEPPYPVMVFPIWSFNLNWESIKIKVYFRLGESPPNLLENKNGILTINVDLESSMS